jgi:hypothetical protein
MNSEAPETTNPEDSSSECTLCAAWEKLSRRRPGYAFACSCGVEWHCVPPKQSERLPPPRYAPDPLPALPRLTVTVLHGWVWTPSVADDIPALVWAPGANDHAVSETDDERAARVERREVRASNCRRRLAWMRSMGGQGTRYADVVFYVHGSRGAALNSRSSCAEAVAERFAEIGERPVFRERFMADNPRMSLEQVDRLDAMAFGNAVIAAAEAAYDHGTWDDVVPAEAVRKLGAREAKWRAIADRVATLRAEAETIARRLTGK